MRGKHDANEKLVVREEGPAGSFALPDNEDIYYCVSEVGAGGRKTLGRVRVLVIDDVGTLIDREAFKMFFPLEPSFVVESSSGNFQVGFIIKGGMAVEEYKALREAMKGSPIWGASHGISPAHIFRLPQGTHTKISRGGWKVRSAGDGLQEYEPEQIWEAAPVGAPRVAPAPRRFEWTLGDDALEALVDLIPNGLGVDHNEWAAVAHGIQGAGGEFEIFRRFSARWEGGYDPDDTETLWNTLPESKSGGGLLRQKAEAADPAGFEAWRMKWEPTVVFDDGEAPPPPDFTDGGGALEPMQRAVADGIVRSHSEVFRFNHDSGCWHQFSGAAWEPLPKSVKAGFVLAERWAARHSHTLGRADMKAVNKANFYDGVESILRQRLVIRQEEFDRDPWLLGTPGGTVELRTGRLRGALPGDFISKLTRVAPAVREDCPRWLRFVGEITKGDAASILFLKQWFGYCLTGDVTEQVFLFLYGPGGNGKSVLVDTVAWVMGTYFRKPVDDLYVKKQGTRHKAEEAMLAGARMISVNEVPVGSSWDEAKLKLHTGGGDITANHMRENPFSFTPVFKITVLGNHQPTFPGGMDPAIKRRFRMMLMDFVPKRADRKLEQTLRAEGAGILRWMIGGLCDASQGWNSMGLLIPDAVLAVTDEYVAEQDILARWVGDRVEERVGALTASEPLHRDWIEYRNAQGEQVDLYSSVHSFVKELDRRGWSRARTNAVKGFRDKVLKAKVNSVFEDD